MQRNRVVADWKRDMQFDHRSAHECAAIIDVAKRLDAVALQPHDEARDLLLRIVSMLVRMARSLRD